MPPPKTTIVAIFPPGFFLENMTSTADGGLLVTVANRQQLYYIPPPPPTNAHPATPLLLETFAPDQWTMGIIPSPGHPNLFLLLTTDFTAQGSRTSHLWVLDLGNAGTGARPKPIMTFPPECKALNGLCALSDTVLLAADSFASCIWRIDLNTSQSPTSASARVWCAHETMAATLTLPDFQPGANGLKYSKRTACVYYTSTQRLLFCGLGITAATLEAAGEPVMIARGMQGDDMIIDDEFAGGPVAYVTTHRDNTILRVPLERNGQTERVEKMEGPSGMKVVAAGSELDETLLGPTSGVWENGKEGKVAYFTADGGLKHSLPDGIVRCAKVVRVEF